MFKGFSFMANWMERIFARDSRHIKGWMKSTVKKKYRDKARERFVKSGRAARKKVAA